MKVELKKANEAAKEASKASVQAAYNRGVDETEICLADELAKVCRDYCKEVWIEAFNLAGVPATSKWRKEENFFYPQDIRVILSTLPPPATATSTTFEQPSSPRSFLLLLRFPKSLARLVNQARRWKRPRIRIRERGSSLCLRPKGQRSFLSPRMLLPRPRMLHPKQRRWTQVQRS